jgi:DNA-binding winged helix-turn-helix (wHTH) protein
MENENRQLRATASALRDALEREKQSHTELEDRLAQEFSKDQRSLQQQIQKLRDQLEAKA